MDTPDAIKPHARHLTALKSFLSKNPLAIIAVIIVIAGIAFYVMHKRDQAKINDLAPNTTGDSGNTPPSSPGYFIDDGSGSDSSLNNIPGTADVGGGGSDSGAGGGQGDTNVGDPDPGSGNVAPVGGGAPTAPPVSIRTNPSVPTPAAPPVNAQNPTAPVTTDPLAPAPPLPVNDGELPSPPSTGTVTDPFGPRQTSKGVTDPFGNRRVRAGGLLGAGSGTGKKKKPPKKHK